MSDPVLGAPDLRRAVLSRQLLLDRATADVATAVGRVGSMQAQYAPSPYIGLWSRVAAFSRDDLTTALERRVVVQGTMMRATIHLSAAADYWPLNLAIRASRRTWYLRVRRTPEADAQAAADRVRAALSTAGRLTRAELDGLAGADSSYVGLFVDLVRVPPSGTWERRRADLFARADDWVGPEPALALDEATAHLVRHYLGGFGPASVKEIASWAGTGVAALKPAVDDLTARGELVRYRAGDGAVLVDVATGEIPAATTSFPVRFLGTWEALLLVHARRAEILREDDRPRIFGSRTPQSFNTFLVDGVVAGTWRVEAGAVEVTPWRPLTSAARAAVDDEAARLLALFAEDRPPVASP